MAQEKESGLQDVRSGMTVEVLTPDNKLTFLGKIGEVESAMLQIVGARGEELPPVLYNEKVKLRAFGSGGRTIVFFGQVCGSSDKAWWVDRLYCMNHEERREYFRQSISVSAQALHANSIFQPEYSMGGRKDIQPQPCQLVDISLGGLLMVSKETYQQGDWLLVTGASIVSELETFSFTCRVVRVIQDEQGRTRYGCQFVGLTPKEEDRLLQAILLAQRKDLQKKRAQQEL